MFGFLFSPMGRISRKAFWLYFVLPYLVLSFIADTIDSALFPSGTAIFSLLIGLFYLWPSVVAVPVKRFHDRNMTGWWVLYFVLFFIAALVPAAIGGALLIDGNIRDLFAQMEEGARPTDDQIATLQQALFMAPLIFLTGALVIGVWLAELIILGFLPGTEGDNRYGPDPRLTKTDPAEATVDA